jgi:tight adherence protein C
MMLLFLSLLCLGGAAFLVAEVATYPARLKERSLKRAVDYGRVKIRATDLERLRFRERVVAPAASRLASIPLKLSPRTTLESVQTKLVAAGLSQRLSPQAFLAIKGAALVGGGVLGFLMSALGSFVYAIALVPLLGGIGFFACDSVLTMRTRSRRESVKAELPDALDLRAVSLEAGLGLDRAIAKLT